MSKTRAELYDQSKPMMAAIGAVAHEWALLEYSVNEQIWKLASITPHTGACLTAQIQSVMPKMRALIALVRMHGLSENLAKSLNAFTSDISGLAARRNRVVHDPWFFREDDTVSPADIEFGRLEVTAERRLVFEVKPQTPEDVLEISREISAAKKTFEALRAQISAEIEALTEEHFGKQSGSAPGLPDRDNDTS